MEILTSENIVQREQHEPDSKLSMVYLYVTLRNRVTFEWSLFTRSKVQNNSVDL